MLEVHTDSGSTVLLAVAGQVANGQLLAVGDPSIVMNSMLRYAGNKTFARQLVHYAAGDDAGERGRGRLYMAEGGFEQVGIVRRRGRAGWASARARAKEACAIRSEGLTPTMAYVLAVLVGVAVICGPAQRRAARTRRRPRGSRVPSRSPLRGGWRGTQR